MVNLRIVSPTLRRRLGSTIARSPAALPSQRPLVVNPCFSAAPFSAAAARYRLTPWHRDVGTAHTKQSVAPTVTVRDKAIELDLMTTSFESGPLPAIWLRDNCRCPECFHSETKQRLVDVFSLRPDIRVKKCREQNGEIKIHFNDGHRGRMSREFLEKMAFSFVDRRTRDALYEPKLWDSNVKNQPPYVEYEAVMNSERAVGKWTALIREYGFCYVQGCPITPEATQELLERIAFIRHTHYGGFWDFTSDLASKDTAYTSMALEAHTDNTYFSEPARLQMFHMLSHTDGDGGASLLVDGFKVARKLKKLDPWAYGVLSTRQVNSHASGNEGISIVPAEMHPVIIHKRNPDHLSQIRWNNSDRAAVHTSLKTVKDWYTAARKFKELIESPKYEYRTQLVPGVPLIFDNWRVLHGRQAFTGKRRVCGGYISDDDFMSRYRTLNFPGGGCPV